MTTALRYRLFGIGKAPPPLRTMAAAEPGVLVDAEGLSIAQAVQDLRIPRARVRAGKRPFVGAIVLSPGRLALSVGRHVIVDRELRSRAGGPVELALQSDGVHLGFAVADLVPDGSGTVTVHYRLALGDEVLAALPVTTARIELADRGAAGLNPWKGSWAA